MEQIITGIAGSKTRGSWKPDNGFREVMHKIHENTPGSQLDKTQFF